MFSKDNCFNNLHPIYYNLNNRGETFKVMSCFILDSLSTQIILELEETLIHFLKSTVWSVFYWGAKHRSHIEGYTQVIGSLFYIKNIIKGLSIIK